jgi:hypothetical protein
VIVSWIFAEEQPGYDFPKSSGTFWACLTAQAFLHHSRSAVDCSEFSNSFGIMKDLLRIIIVESRRIENWI